MQRVESSASYIEDAYVLSLMVVGGETLFGHLWTRPPSTDPTLYNIDLFNTRTLAYNEWTLWQEGSATYRVRGILWRITNIPRHHS